MQNVLFEKGIMFFIKRVLCFIELKILMYIKNILYFEISWNFQIR